MIHILDQVKFLEFFSKTKFLLKKGLILYIFQNNISKKQDRQHKIYLLYLTKYNHFCLINDINRFLSSYINKHNGRKFVCYCLQGFQTEASLNEHKTICSESKPGFMKSRKLHFLKNV